MKLALLTLLLTGCAAGGDPGSDLDNASGAENSGAGSAGAAVFGGATGGSSGSGSALAGTAGVDTVGGSSGCGGAVASAGAAGTGDLVTPKACVADGMPAATGEWMPPAFAQPWSAPQTWGGKVPAAGVDVTIPKGQTIVLDGAVTVKNSSVLGTLDCANQDRSSSTTYTSLASSAKRTMFTYSRTTARLPTTSTTNSTRLLSRPTRARSTRIASRSTRAMANVTPPSST